MMKSCGAEGENVIPNHRTFEDWKAGLPIANYGSGELLAAWKEGQSSRDSEIEALISSLKALAGEWHTEKWLDGHLAEWSVVIPQRHCSWELLASIESWQTGRTVKVGRQDGGM